MSNLMSDAVMPPEVEYEVWQGGDWVAGSNDRADAEHYLTIYGQDGPVEAKTSFTYRVEGFTDEHALAASTPVGGWEDISTAPKDGTNILMAAAPSGPAIHWRYGVGSFSAWPTETVGGPLLWDWPWGNQPTHWQPIVAPPPPSVSIDNGSRPQEAVPTEGHDAAVLADLSAALKAVEYVPGDHPVVPIKHDAFVKAVRAIVEKHATPQPADGCSSNEGAG